MRRLNKSVVAGGVVYPAGASGADVEAAVTNAAHWNGPATDYADAPVPAGLDAVPDVPATPDAPVDGTQAAQTDVPATPDAPVDGTQAAQTDVPATPVEEPKPSGRRTRKAAGSEGS